MRTSWWLALNVGIMREQTVKELRRECCGLALIPLSAIQLCESSFPLYGVLSTINAAA